MNYKYKRIMIFGKPGAGKSTFASSLSKILKLPVFHLDKYFFKENWLERNYEEFLDIQKKIVTQNEWIIDGNSLKSFELRYAHANLVLYFNLPNYVCYYRIFKRFLFPNKLIDDRAKGCREAIRFSLLKYLWNYEERVSETLLYLKDKYPDVSFVEINRSYEKHKVLNLWKLD